MQLDHLFAFVEDGPAAEAAARAIGLVPTHRRIHHGQGTANVCFAFGPVFLELLWAHDQDELASAAVARTGLAERSRYRDNGACPFGVCLSAAAVPFETWTYDVPFPPGMSAEMAITSDDAREPVVFAFAGAPREPAPSAQPLGQAITHVELAYAGARRRSEAVACLGDLGIGLVEAAAPRLTLTIDGAPEGRALTIEGAPVTLRL